MPEAVILIAQRQGSTHQYYATTTICVGNVVVRCIYYFRYATESH